MSDQKETGGPAFPTLGSAHEIPGMSLRDYFAAKALSVVADPSFAPQQVDYEIAVAQFAYRVADAMLLEREK